MDFVNLTNGIEAIKQYSLTEYRFVRIQSTACEQKRWDFILQELDYGFLMALALGAKCVVYDYSNKRRTPRALWQGIEWIKYALNRAWFDRKIVPAVRGHNASNYFDGWYRQLGARTKAKLRYFVRFLDTDEIRLDIVGGRTDLDGNYPQYAKMVGGQCGDGKRKSL